MISKFADHFHNSTEYCIKSIYDVLAITKTSEYTNKSGFCYEMKFLWVEEAGNRSFIPYYIIFDLAHDIFA